MAIQLPRPPRDLGEITFETYLQLPENRQRYDIIDGVMNMSPAPSDVHQWDLAHLYDLLKAHVAAGDLGVVLFAPLDLIIRKSPKLTTRQPDLAYFSWESIGGKGLEALKEARRRGVAPALSVEILSPDQSKAYMERKLRDYAEISIREVWLVSRETKTVEVLVLEGNEYVCSGVYDSGQNLVCKVLSGLEIGVDSIFEN